MQNRKKFVVHRGANENCKILSSKEKHKFTIKLGLNLNDQKQARKVLKLVKKNIPLFLKKRHEEFLKTSNVFSKTSNVFFKTTVCFKEPSSAKYKSLIMKQIQVYPCE